MPLLRAAGFLAIAVLGIVMLNCFERALDQKLSGLQLSSEVRQSVQGQYTKLAAISVPENFDDLSTECSSRD